MKWSQIAFAATIALIGTASFVRADEMPGKDWISADALVQKLKDAGYTGIAKIEAEDGAWEGKGMKNGETMKFHADAHTGAILSEKPDHEEQEEMPGKDWISADGLMQKLKDAGYTGIAKIEAEDGAWEGKGVKNGETMKFHADAHTGAIFSEKPEGKDHEDSD
jgi:sugar phosphate isomerase/epimerase